MYCVCNGEEKPGMIGCDNCDEWYHPQCLNLHRDDVKRLANVNWSCPKCITKKGKINLRKYWYNSDPDKYGQNIYLFILTYIRHFR